MTVAVQVTSRLFNTPVESALRSLFVLVRISPEQADLQRLLMFDYLLVHSGDFVGGPTSIHPPTPLRNGELLVRRKSVVDGVKLLESRSLVEKSYTSQGITYGSSRIAAPFLTYFTSTYALRLGEVAGWIATEMQPLASEEIRELIEKRVGQWGIEFEGSLLEGE